LEINKGNAGGYRDPMYYTSGEAIVHGDYKLIVGGVMKGPFGGAGMLLFSFVSTLCLSGV
jgi:hypothetical protein